MNGPMDMPIGVAPIVNQFPGGATFQGAGNSHFTCVGGQFHVTTEIGGLKQGCPVVDHTYVNDRR